MSGQSLLFDIKHYSINDGPGIRVTVFFKGCPMSCNWCHNPESQSAYIQKLYNSTKCIGCKLCLEACPTGAISFDIDKGIITDPAGCTLCGAPISNGVPISDNVPNPNGAPPMCGICARVCPSKATELSGWQDSVENIMRIILRDTVVMDTSGGGVTFSGGEPLQYPELLLQLLKECGKEVIHRAVDTAGYVNSETLLKVAEHTDLFLYDLKLMDSHLHQKYTGVPNEKILENLRLLSKARSKIIIRIPLIEGVNADVVNIDATAKFIASLEGEPKPVHLLPYHAIAATKYQKLGNFYDPGTMEKPNVDTIAKCIGIFLKYNLKVKAGG